ncbi:endonuclease [Candidatus Woesearchaeota archaeon]|nr:endonuclease [Candidatus Woesearchaeota archaeon]
MNKIKLTYTLLYNSYGPQGWWPLTSKYKFIPEHKGEKPDTEQRKFEIIIGAIMTQNTAWANVEKAIINLNKKKLLSIEKIRKLPEKKLAELIKPSGYYNQKAKKIKAMIKFLDSKKPITRENILSVWGVGPETADSMLLYAYEQPYFVVDAYTKRLFSRLGFCNEKDSYEFLQALFHQNLDKNVDVFKEYHALIVEHCKRFCRKKPDCKGCVLMEECRHNKK